MNCPSCGVNLPRRPTARIVVTGSLLIAAGFLLLLFVHIAVVVLASVVLAAFGATMLSGAKRARLGRCPSCRAHLPR